ncbi:DUF4177 domain-containing protein [Mesobaculum littorinae]|uniref:DUF4177 domain-containing protein n=1 Tax=Mesobaculum littorinae TaxID=2486419 RepID=A0A438AJD0_9RHOB|nr:DUF4177 domain-containing protein [Mesobaculum littorinae]RVV98788.1 DUF4177 domain-containing protein [Mesobaculum littorinae]
MPLYEYTVVPAPKKGAKARGVRGTEARFAHALTELINEKAVEGWEYLRAEALPSEERSGMIGKTRVVQNLLVFRRPRPGEGAWPAASAQDMAFAHDPDRHFAEDPAPHDAAGASGSAPDPRAVSGAPLRAPEPARDGGATPGLGGASKGAPGSTVHPLPGPGIRNR